MTIDLQNTTFEEALSRLEIIVDTLEKGDASLEASIKLFDEGMKLSLFCNQKMEWAEQQVEQLIKENGEFVKKPYLIE